MELSVLISELVHLKLCPSTICCVEAEIANYKTGLWANRVEVTSILIAFRW